MATITQENLGVLHEKLNVTIAREDYLPAFEKALKDYGKKANIPGFRKGQVPSGLIKKMVGTSVFTDEVLRTVNRELFKYLEDSKLNIFAQPLPLEMDTQKMNMNNPEDYTFSFEVGMKPGFRIPELSKVEITRYKVNITDEMITNEINRLQNRFGNMKDLDTAESEENVLNLTFIETDENGNEIEGGIRKENSALIKYFGENFRKELIGKHVGDFVVIQLNQAFDEKEREWIMHDLGLDKNEPTVAEKHWKVVITKIGLLEKKELNEEFYQQLYPSGEIKTETEFRNKLKEELQSQWDTRSRTQLQDQIYHQLIDHTEIEFPEIFLKKWMRTQSQQEKSDEEVETEFPTFINQLKWSLITDHLIHENKIEVTAPELRQFAREQLLGYMGMGVLQEEEAWVKDYVERMMKDTKYVDDAYNRIETRKIFEWAEHQVTPVEKEISAEDFMKMQEHHHH